MRNKIRFEGTEELAINTIQTLRERNMLFYRVLFATILHKTTQNNFEIFIFFILQTNTIEKTLKKYKGHLTRKYVVVFFIKNRPKITIYYKRRRRYRRPIHL